MSTPTFHDTPEIVIAATLWLMRRHRLTGCPAIARLVEQHLNWLAARTDEPRLADAGRRLALTWHARADSPLAGRSPVLH